nr:peptidoglycan DD-metalloendopeptidase family protein [Actinomycetales bacterium]
MNNIHAETTATHSIAAPLTRREARALRQAQGAADGIQVRRSVPSARTPAAPAALSSEALPPLTRREAAAHHPGDPAGAVLAARITATAASLSKQGWARPSILGRSAVLAVLAATTVGAPVNALLGENQKGTAEAASMEPVQRVVVSADGSFLVDDPAAGVEASQRDAIASSRTEGREALAELEPEFRTESDALVAEAGPEAGADSTPETSTEPSAAETQPSTEAGMDESADATAEAPEVTPAPEGEDVVENVPATDETVTDPEFMGEPTDEGGIPVDAEQQTGTDFPAEPAAVVADGVGVLAPQIAVDATAVWVSGALLAEGTVAIGVEVNLDRLELLEDAQAILDESDGQLDDPQLRNNVATAMAELEGAADEAWIASASDALDSAIGELRGELSSLNSGAAMRAASADARAALARGRAYNPSESIDFGMTGWVNPVASGRFTSTYGNRGFVAGSSAFHNGIDLAASSGTSIRAGADGVVTYVGFGHSSRGLTGWTIIVAHGNGLETAYNHMYSSGVYVSEGQAVRAGDVIGGVGSTGRSTGPHLHLTVWQDGEHINPKTFFSRQGVSF